jgi:hypothetical protein
MVLQVSDPAATAVIDDILSLICDMLRSQTNGRVPKEVRVYAQCFAQCCHVNLGELVAAKLFIGRLQKRHPNLHATFAVDSMIRIYITAIILAAKFLNDSVHPNSEWASASGRYTTADVNKMELEFLVLTHYELFISPSEHAIAIAHYKSKSDDAPVATTTSTVAKLAVSEKQVAPWRSCSMEEMDVAAAVSAVVDGPMTSSPDVYAARRHTLAV